MNKLRYFELLLDFIPELFPPDLSAITLSDCNKFIKVWGRNNPLGKSLKEMLYPGKLLEENVMLGKVMEQNKKITKYFTKDESITGIAYLAVGVPIYEEDKLVGGICVVREETILETQERCKHLYEVQEILSQSMNTLSSRLSHVISSYENTRNISNYVQDISQKAHLLNINTLLEKSQFKDGEQSPNLEEIIESINNLAVESKKTTGKIINLLNDFDNQNIDLLSSINQIETTVKQMTYSINDIMLYLNQQTNSIINGK